MKKVFWCVAIALAMALWMSCVGSDVTAPPSSGGGGGGAAGPTVSGVASKGPLQGADVEIDAINDADGSKAASLGTGKTDSNGKFSIQLSSAPTTPLRVSVTGGTFVSEMDGKSVISNSATLTAVITDPTSIPNPVNVTLATSLLDTMAQGYAAGATPPSYTRRKRNGAGGSSCKGGMKAGMPCAMSTLGGFYGGIPSPGGSGFGGTPTVTSDSDIDAFKIGLLSGAVADCANKVYPSDPGKFFKAIFQDASDLVFDGKKNGKTIYIDDPTDSVPLSSTALTTDFLLCLNDFVGKSSVLAGSGISSGDISKVTGEIDNGVTNSPLTPKGLGLSAGGSGAIATLAFNGRQYLFVAGRSSGVVVIDITDPTATSPMVKDWANVTTVLGSTSSPAIVGGVIPIIGTASHGQVVAFAYSTGVGDGKTMALLNADLMVTGDPTSTTDQANIVDQVFTPTFTSPNPESVSGGSGYVLGGISDPGDHGIWMATVDGYKFLDISLATPDFTTVYSAFSGSGSTTNPAVAGAFSAENLGGDIPHTYLLGGNYQSVELVDLTKGPYLMDDPTLMLLPSGDVAYPDVDGNAIDSALQVGVLTYEDTPKFTFVNMGAATRTDSTNGGPGSFSVPSSGIVTVDGSSNAAAVYPTFSGSAVDGTTHMGLLMAGYSTDMGVFQIQDPSAVASGSSWTGASNWSVYKLCGTPGTVLYPTSLGYCTWGIATDPHAVGAIFNINNSKSYGYLLDGSNCSSSGCAPYTRVAQIDFAAFLSGSTSNTFTGDPAASGGPILLYTWTVPASAHKVTVTNTQHKHPHN